jgi:hypothetical protein
MNIDPGWLFFLVIGIALSLGALLGIISCMKFVARAEATEGTVIGLRERISRKGYGSSFAPTVRFHATSGKQIEFTDSVSSRPARHIVGQTLRVLYDPDKPNDARVAGSSVYFGPLVLMVIGLGFAGLGGAGMGLVGVVSHMAAPGGGDVGMLGGEWVNENAEASGITRLNIERRWYGISTKVWGKCHPVDCDWGSPESYIEPAAASGEMSLTWRTRFAARSQQLTLLRDGRLRVVTDTHFTDKSRRPDFTSTEYFRRQ